MLVDQYWDVYYYFNLGYRYWVLSINYFVQLFYLGGAIGTNNLYWVIPVFHINDKYGGT